MKLRLSPDLALPLDFATKTCAILAQRRKGKTYTASVLAEEMVAAKQPFVALDPTGAWWGLRASADGEKPGLPVVILGGQHADLPLERTGGKLVADLVVEEPGYYVIDFSLFESGEAERQFSVDFAERLYRAKGQAGRDFPLHLYVDEADRFIPQSIRKGSTETSARLLGAFEAIVRRGGLRGLGTTLISQRAAVVNKNVLEMLDVLIVLRTVGPNDRDAIDGYIKAHGTGEERTELLGSLASLPIGEAWIWEPGAEPPLFERVTIRERHTFNSSATPKVGQKRVEPKRLAPVDLEKYRARMSATIERAKADDPKALRAELAELRRQMTAAVARGVVPDPAALERARAEGAREAGELADRRVAEIVARIQERDQHAAKAINRLGSELTGAMSQLRDQACGLFGEIEAALCRSIDLEAETIARQVARPPVVVSRPQMRAENNNRPVGRPEVARNMPRNMRAVRGTAGGTLPKAEQALLDAAAWLRAIGAPSPWRRVQLAFVAGYSPGSSSTGNAISALSTAGFITYPIAGSVEPTEAGWDLAREPEAPPSQDELHSMVLEMLGAAERAFLTVAIRTYPKAVTRDDGAAQAGYAPTSSSTGNAISRLHTLDLITYPQRGMFRAADFLFL